MFQYVSCTECQTMFKTGPVREILGAYVGFMSDASEKRAQDSKSITDKEAAKAETEEELQTNGDSKTSKTTEAMETAKYIGGLHEECDWLCPLLFPGYVVRY